MASHQKRDRLIAWTSIAAVTVITIIIVGFIFPGADEGTVGNGVEEPDRMVSVIHFEPGAIVSEIAITGRVASADRIELFSEVQGRFDNGSKPFRTGISFNEGDTLALIDDTEERLALISQRSRFLTALSGVLSTLKLDYPDLYESWAEYTDQFDPEALIQELPAVENRQARLFLHQEVFMSSSIRFKAPKPGLKNLQLLPRSMVSCRMQILNRDRWFSRV